MKRIIAKYTVLIMILSSILIMGVFYSFTVARLKNEEITYIENGVNRLLTFYKTIRYGKKMQRNCLKMTM